MKVLAASIAMLCVMSVPCAAQDDIAGATDHPMFSRMPGYVITSYDAQDFSNFEFAVDPAKAVEGRYWQIDYELKEGAKKIGPVQLARNYTDLMIKRGGKRLIESVDAGGGTTVATLSVGPEGQTSRKNLWLQLSINNDGELFTLTIVEEAGMEQKVEFTAMELAAALRTSGFVALHSVLFDTGKATIKPESSDALGAIGELLKGDSGLKLEIQGHTDNVGASAVNLRLSQDRAASVKAYLVETFRINAERLTTSGFGDTKPVGDNKADAGRAQNRRVELVKK